MFVLIYTVKIIDNARISGFCYERTVGNVTKSEASYKVGHISEHRCEVHYSIKYGGIESVLYSKSGQFILNYIGLWPL